MMRWVHFLITSIVVWTISISISFLAVIRLLVIKIRNCLRKKHVDRVKMIPPACLSDPKYSHKYMFVNRIRFHYVENGDPSKPLMIFVHGFPEFWYSWRHQLTEFSKDYWTVAIDLRGYAGTDKPHGIKNYHMEYLVSDLKIFIEQLNRKSCILVSHDWGTVVGWKFLAAHREMVQKHIMMAGASQDVYLKLLKTWQQFSKALYIFFFQMPILPELLIASDDYAVFDAIYNGKFNENFTEEDLDAYKFTFSRPGAINGPMNYYRANFSYFPTESDADKLGDGDGGLFIYAQDDKYISQESCTVIAKLYPKMHIEIVPNANHFVQQDAPQRVNELIRRFIGDANNYSTE